MLEDLNNTNRGDGTRAYIYIFRSTSTVTFNSIYVSGYSTTTGLWKTCTGERCSSFDCSSSSYSSSTCGQIMAARAFLTLTCLLSPFIGAGFILWAFLHDRMPSVLLLVLKIGIFVCLLFGIIGVAIGIAATIKPSEISTSSISVSIGAGAILGIIAIIANLVGGIIGAIVR